MTFLEKIKNDLTSLMKSKQELDVLVLRQILAAVLNKEKEKRYKLSKDGVDGEKLKKESQLSEEEILAVVVSEAKKRKEAIVEFEKGARDDLVKKEKAELVILEKYLPSQLSKEEIISIAKEIMQKLNVQTAKDIGKVMSELMPKLRGRADGMTVSNIVRELLP
ncbi:MAG: hypothetical protein A3H01_02180 [Candidatus Wildermuthbacteria bacterium RIFCSPLOWO2_12_FULL_40_9]|uniref:Aspartyl-tRNA amidotransferase n=2 Tax=Candidatus Wildermuthiibacteriota TaxID=1817923 RepID=A0A1G2RE97_9BACT|nr:MAG: hypothetical protein A3F15_00885 [Candidatus Wildermuthbacteria bacterium RIFCSPHIGHO2_12_FULL_40_12]OHA76212.1 MAG: hypothetical protein A3H01_02180 [Candidatus Wildermuthbacteria bacterium RIFCSPLOWO2_12_FULL_40_9]